ncbi:MAG: hypothetical protein ABJ079_00205 [Marinomonas sp.]
MIDRMRPFYTPFLSATLVVSMTLTTATLLPSEAAAQSLFSKDAPEAGAEVDGGSSLMERGAELFLRGLRDEMAPTLEGLQELMEEIGPSMGDFLSTMGPALADIATKVEDWSAYELPEMLPNGDIIIRKKPRDAAPTGDSSDIEI